MATLQIYQFPCLSDNFGVLIHDPEAGLTASIDAPEADKVTAALNEKGWKLTHVLTTHHHADHTGGNAALKAATGCRIIGPRKEAGKVPGFERCSRGARGGSGSISCGGSRPRRGLFSIRGARRAACAPLLSGTSVGRCAASRSKSASVVEEERPRKEIGPWAKPCCAARRGRAAMRMPSCRAFAYRTSG